MILHMVEATNHSNWGKFAVCRPGPEERAHRSQIDDLGRPLLGRVGWTAAHIWVMDLQTGEGAIFMPGGHARNDLAKHKIWVCPMFEPFLAWLYQQDLTDLSQLPALVELPDAPFAMHGYRRTGTGD